MAQGHVMDNIERSSPSLRYREPMLMMRNDPDGICVGAPAAWIRHDGVRLPVGERQTRAFRCGAGQNSTVARDHVAEW